MARDQSMSPKCSECGNNDPDQITVQEKGVVNELRITRVDVVDVSNARSKIHVEHMEVSYDNAKYNLHCCKCGHDWHVDYEELVF